MLPGDVLKADSLFKIVSLRLTTAMSKCLVSTNVAIGAQVGFSDIAFCLAHLLVYTSMCITLRCDIHVHLDIL